jgi:hypothetical protein
MLPAPTLFLTAQPRKFQGLSDALADFVDDEKVASTICIEGECMSQLHAHNSVIGFTDNV